MIINGQDPVSIATAAHAVRRGALVGLPTETVYGLAANASSDAAVAQIFKAKGRPSDHPLIVHVAAAEGIHHFASAVPDFAQKLIDAFWPGPLTVILPRLHGVADAATGNQNSVGLRCPAHPVARALLLACAAPEDGTDQGGPPVWGLAAPSANRFGRVSPTTARHVQDELGAELLILDGGPCAVGIESTIVDCTRGVPVLLRPGTITHEQITAACGIAPLGRHALPALTPRASGTLESHYAPNAKVRLMEAKALQTGLDLLGSDAPHVAVYSRTALRGPSNPRTMRRMPNDAAATAQQLFAVLRELDGMGVKLIWIETPPTTPEWDGVRDRLQRAAAT